MKRYIPLLVGSLVSLFAAPASKAAVITLYSFTGSVNTVTSEDANVTSTAFTANSMSSVNSSSTANTGSTSGSPAASATGMDGVFDAANNFWSFTITPDPDYAVTLTDFSFNYNRADANSADEWRLRYSFDNFVTNTEIQGATALGGSVNTGQSASDSFTIPGITNSNPIYFRLYTYSAGGSGSRLSLDDVRLEGSIVPEPSTSVLILGGLGLLLASHRARRHTVCL